MPLRVLFLDLNSYFASVEQQERPVLRGRPVGVVPVMAETSCCIAASYEAKAFGVKTGTAVAEAKRLCPGITLVEARPATYVEYHHRIVAAVESCLPVQAIHSVDEMHCRLIGAEREPARAREIALNMKRTIAERVGEYLRSSIGIAPNRFLAKVGTELEKPDGLVVIEDRDLPEKLYSLTLRDLPGIGPRMHERLIQRGITTVEQLCAVSESHMSGIWQSIIGRQWHAWLRGREWDEPPTRRRSIGHQHVLPPELRTSERSRGVLIRLIHKAAARLRQLRYRAQRMTIDVRLLDQHGKWSSTVRFGPTQDTLTLLESFRAIWPPRLPGSPLRVGVTLHDLVSIASDPVPLFPGEQRRQNLAGVMDRINARHGAGTLYPGSMHESRDAAPMRIPFQTIPDVNLPA